MYKENLKDAGEIIHTILHQPFTATGNANPLSLIETAKEFKKHPTSYSELSRVLLSFVEYPESTQSLLVELDLICADLTAK
jgi:hypothetical protein